MIRLRHILHPVGSARSLYRRARDSASRHFYTWIAEREYSKIPRGQRDNCWCGGQLRLFKWHASYATCAECGCYVDRNPPLPETLNEVYSLDRYWRLRQKMKQHAPIETRGEIFKSEGRVNYWLSLIERYGPPSGRAIEVGCSPGVLLVELQKRGYECIGVEPDAKVAKWIQDNMMVEVRAGLFPDIELPSCNLFLAFDVIEHSYDPLAFLRGVAELLRPDGIAILQTPIDRYQCSERPFGNMFERVFDDLEHQFIFVEKAIQRLTAAAGFRVLAQDQWRVAHEVVVLGRTG